MSPKIRLQLYNHRPRVELNGEAVHIPDSSLDLLIYLAVENRAEHDRDELTLRLYESLEFRENLRKTALGNLNRQVKSLCIRQAPQNALGYDATHVCVDVLEFVRLVKAVSEIKSLTAYKLSRPQLLEAYNLYQDHFLNGYTPTLYGLKPWIQEKQAALRELFHRLLEKLVQYEIVDGRYNEALAYAERWHRSLPTTELPLQYLIWLATSLDSYTMTVNYFNKLDELSSASLRVIGYSPEEWRRLLARGMKPDIAALKLNDVARIEVHDLLEITSQQLIGRYHALEEIFETLFVKRDHSLLTITGERGIGKTALAEAVASACLKAKAVDRVIRVGITSESDFEQILNTIALQADKPHLLDLNYRNKYLSVEQLFEEESDLLILDQQEVGDVFTEDFRVRIRAFSELVLVLVCCHEAWDEVHNIQLGSLDFAALSTLFTTSMNPLDFKAESDTLLAETGGSPLAIKLLMSGMKTHGLSIRNVFAQIGEYPANRVSGDTAFRYQRLLHWCWRLLDPPARRVLASFQDFDLLEGPSLIELHTLHNDLADTTIEEALWQLTSMALIEFVDNGDQSHYRWHSLLHDFLLEIDALAYAADDPHFKSQVQERFCQLQFDYLEQFADDYSHLGRKQRNLIRAFDMRLEHGEDLNILISLNRFIPYLIRCGQFHIARRLAERAEGQFQSLQTHETLALQLNLAKLDIKQGEFQTAETQLIRLLELAKIQNNTRLYSDIFQQLGIIANKNGRPDESSSCYEKAMLYARQHHQDDLLAMILANLGAMCIEHGKHEAAQGYLEGSLKTARDIGQMRIIEYALTALGVVAIEMLEFGKALELLSEALKIANKLESPERFAIILLNMGESHYYLEQYQMAEEFLAKSLEIAQRLGRDELLCRITHDLGKILSARGDHLMAEHHYKQALIMALNLNIMSLIIRIHLDMGKLYFQIHHWQIARSCFRDALEKTMKLREHDLLAGAVFGLGMCAAAERWVIGIDRVEQSEQCIRDALGDPFLAEISEFPLTLDYLRRAEFFFQRGMINFPEIARYQTISALAKLLKI